MEIKTLQDLKDFLGSLSKEQLKQEAVLSIVDSHYEKIASATVTTEDYFVNDDGIDPVSTFEPLHDGDTLANYEIVPAGLVSLSNE